MLVENKRQQSTATVAVGSRLLYLAYSQNQIYLSLLLLFTLLVLVNVVVGGGVETIAVEFRLLLLCLGGWRVFCCRARSDFYPQFEWNTAGSLFPETYKSHNKLCLHSLKSRISKNVNSKQLKQLAKLLSLLTIST